MTTESERTKHGPPIALTLAEERRNRKEALESGRIGGRFSCDVCGMTNHNSEAAWTCCTVGLKRHEMLVGKGINEERITSLVSNAWASIPEEYRSDEYLDAILENLAEVELINGGQYRRYD